jgi:putative transposase
VFNNSNQTGEYPLIHFGQDHDYKFATKMTENLTEKQVGVMDRGFAALEYLKQLQSENKYFVIRANTNYKLEPLERGQWQVGMGKHQGIYRVIWFCDLETKTEYRILTNLPHTVSSEEVAEIYRQRWQIELFLLLIEIPEIWGNTLLDKLRYLQGCMNQEFSYVHWIDRILKNRPFRLLMEASI